MSEAMQALAQIDNVDDKRLIAATIEGESDALEVLDKLVELVTADRLMAERGSERIKRIEARADRLREIVQRMVEKLGLPTIERPLYTATLAHVRKAIVTNPDELPADYIRTAPDMTHIRRDLVLGKEVAGATLSNPAPALVIRTR